MAWPGQQVGRGRGQCGSSSLAGGTRVVGASLGEVHRDTGATGWRKRKRRKSRNLCGQGGEALCRCAVPAAEQGTGHT